MSNPKRVGLLGGSFNPPHFGHINLARELREKHQLDQVWWVPTKQNPDKLDVDLVEASFRVEMVRLSIQDDPDFFLCLEELERPSPSYTVDTLRILCEKYRQEKFFLLLGEDAALCLHTWKEPLEIVKLATILVGTRPCETRGLELGGDPILLEAIRTGWTPIRQMDISSRSIRERLRQQQKCSHLVPQNVLDYILLHSLYTHLSSSIQMMHQKSKNNHQPLK